MRIRSLMIMGAVALCPIAAFGGYVQPAPVTVDVTFQDGEDGPTASGYAAGDQVSARFASTDDDVIGCGDGIVEVNPGEFFQWGFCQATDAEGDAISCFTEAPELIAAIRTIGPLSYISFSVRDGTCTRIRSSTQSFYLPDSLAPKKEKRDRDNEDDD